MAREMPRSRMGYDAMRRHAIRCMEEGREEEAEAMVKEMLGCYQVWCEELGYLKLPDAQLDRAMRALELMVEVLERLGGVERRELAEMIRAEVEEKKTIEEALKRVVIEATRDEATNLIFMAAEFGEENGEEEEVGGKGKEGKRRKQKGGRKGKKKGGESIREDLPPLASLSLCDDEVVEGECPICHEGFEEVRAEKPPTWCPLPPPKQHEEDAEDTEVGGCQHHFHGCCIKELVKNCHAGGWWPFCPECQVKLIQQ